MSPTKILLFLVALAVGLAVFLPVGTRAAGPTYFSTTKTVSGYGSASCSYPWKLTGGGVRSLPSDSFSSYSSTEYKLTGSYPSGSSSWRATATQTRGSYSSSSGWRFSTSSYTPAVYAVCIR